MAIDIIFRGTAPVHVRLASRQQAVITDQELQQATGEISSQAIAGYITALAGDPVTREAIAISSASLSNSLTKMENGEALSRKRLMSVALSLTRYVLRAAGRPTPFGIHAGVAPVHVGGTARAAFSQIGTKSVRPDAAWCHELRKNLLTRPWVRRAMDVVMNDLCVIRGDRLVLSYVTMGAEEEIPNESTYKTGHELSVRQTPVVSWLREQAQHPVGYQQLLEAAAKKFTQVTEEVIDGMLLGLVQNEILLTSFPHDIADADYLGRVIRLLGLDSPEAKELREFKELLDAYAERSVGEGLAQWEDLNARDRATGQKRFRSAAQVDLRTHADIALPHAVIDEVAAYASALWRIGPVEHGLSHMREYQEAFVERYGEGHSVPLPDVLDAHRGLGFPRGYKNPRVSRTDRLAVHERRSSIHGEEDGGPWRKRAELFHRAITHPDRELVLDDEAIAYLTDGAADPVPPPPALELCFQLLARTPTDIDAGRFQLLVSPVTGSNTAGATVARFAHMLGMTDEVRRLVGRNVGDGIAAQVTFQTLAPRALNIALAPDLLPYEIPVGCFPHAGPGRSIDWRDLLLFSDGHGLRLIWRRTGQEVFPLIPHMLAVPVQAPNVARFLAELRHTRSQQTWQSWRWSRHQLHPVTPRVRVGRVIAAPLSWRPSVAMTEAAARPEAFGRALGRWRAELDVPELIRVAVGDRAYDLDLGDRFQQEVLRRDMLKGDVKISEAPSSLGGYGWSDGRSNEIVVPLLGTGRAAKAQTTGRHGTDITDVPALEHDIQPLDEDWLYVQISAVSEGHDQIIQGLDRLMSTAADAVAGWFFIRYYWPEPHIRLRLRAVAPQRRGELWSALHSHLRALRSAGLARGFTVCEYEPETGRYGGARTLPLAEQVFCVDSQIVMAQLTQIAAGRCTLSRDLLIVANYAALLDSLGGWDWADWAGSRFTKATYGSVTRDDIRTAADLAVPGRVAENLEAATGIPGTSRLWRETAAVRELGALLCDDAARHGHRRRRDVALGGLLHMQHNRLIGADRPRETRSTKLLGHVARLHAGRAREGLRS